MNANYTTFFSVQICFHFKPTVCRNGIVIQTDKPHLSTLTELGGESVLSVPFCRGYDINDVVQLNSHKKSPFQTFFMLTIIQKVKNDLYSI